MVSNMKKEGFENLEPETPEDDEEEEKWRAILKAFGRGDFELAEDFGAEFSEQASLLRKRKVKIRKDIERVVEKGEAIVPKGTPGEVFFKMLVEEYPEFKLEIDKDIEEFRGQSAKDYVFIMTDLPDTSEKLKVIRAARSDPVVNFILSNLIGQESKLKQGIRLENKGMLPKHTSKRMMAFWYKRAIKYAEERGHNTDRYKKKLNKLGIEPMTKKEMREIFSEVIEEKLEELDK